MKRGPEDDDYFYLQEVEFLEREIKKTYRVEEGYVGDVFVIVRGKTTGLFKTYQEVVALGGNDRFSVYKKFSSKRDALAWYNASIARPSVYVRNAFVIEIAYRDYDVTQDKDYACAVSMFFKANDKRNFSKPVNPWRLMKTQMDIDCLLFLEALKHNPTGIITNSKRLAYGINCGLWNWPKHTIVSPPTALFKQCYDLCLEYCVAVDWGEKTAFEQCTSMCVAISCNNVNFEKAKKREASKEAFIWMLCAKRLGIIKDIARLIGRMIQTRNFDYDYF